MDTIRRTVISLIELVCLPFTLIIWAFGLASSPNEAYDSFDHLALNVTRPKTEWLNMGDWSDTTEFPVACAQLAQRLHRAAAIRPGASILDVGHGTGDSLLLLLQAYAPHTLHGVTSMRAHADRARDRVRQVDTKADVRVFCEDAVHFVRRMAADPNAQKYDFILALDCAYHFTPSRASFLAACMSLLRPGGTIALQDLIAAHPYPTSDEGLCFSPSPSLPSPPSPTYAPTLLQRWKHAFVLLMSNTPSINIISAREYVAQLRSLGLRDIHIHDSSHVVFPGFANFLLGLGRNEERMWRGGSTLQWFGLRSFGDVVETWSQGGAQGMVRSVTVVAKT